MRTGNLDLMLGAQIKNFRPEVLAADPAVGDLVASQEARIWYNSTDKKYKYFDGTEIKEFGAGSGPVEGVILADGTVPMTADLLLSGPDQSASGDNAAVSKKHVETVVATKQDKISGLTENGVVIAGADSELQTSNVTAAELGYLSGASSNIQSQITAVSNKANANETALAGKLDAASGQLTGDLDANGNTVANLAAPVNANDAARKIDIDNAIAGIDWLQDSDAIQQDGTLDPELVAGKQYLILAADQINPNFGSITDLVDNMIVRYDGTKFVIVFDPTDSEAGGAVTWVKAIKEYRRFDGTQWTTFGGASEFNAGAGLEKSGNVVNVKVGAGVQIIDNAVTAKLDASGGLEDNAGSTRVKLDGSSLSRTVDGIAIAEGGVGYAEVSPSALGTGLKQDTENSKIIVDVAAVKTAGGFIDATGGSVEALTLTGTDPLTDDSVPTKKYVDDAIAAGSGGSAAKLYLYDKTAGGDAAASTHTFEHNSGNKFGTVTVVDDTGYQIIPDEVVFIDDNSLRVELTTAKKVAIAFVTGPKSEGSSGGEAPPAGPTYNLLLAQNKGNVTPSSTSEGRFIAIDDGGTNTVKSASWSFTGTQGIQSFGVLLATIGMPSNSTLPLPITGTVTATITLRDDSVITRTLEVNETEDVPYVRAGACHSATLQTQQLFSPATKTIRMFVGTTVGFGMSDLNGNSFRPGTNPSSALLADETIASVKWSIMDAGTVADIDLSKFTLVPSTLGYVVNLSSTYDASFFTANRMNPFAYVVFEATTSTGRVFRGAYGVTGNTTTDSTVYSWGASAMADW